MDESTWHIQGVEETRYKYNEGFRNMGKQGRAITLNVATAYTIKYTKIVRNSHRRENG